MNDKIANFLIAAHDAQVQDKQWIAGELMKANSRIKADAKVIAALREALKQIAEMPPPRDTSGKIYDAEQKTALAALAADEQNVEDGR